MQKSMFQTVTSLSFGRPRFLHHWINRLTQWAAQRIAQTERRAIVKSALLATTGRYPEWVDVGFDEHFLTHQGMPHMADYYQSGQLPDATALAEAWSNQFFWPPATKQSAKLRFLPIAQEFVYVLSTEPQ